MLQWPRDEKEADLNKELSRTSANAAAVVVHPDSAIGEVSPHLYGRFSEHLATVVYGGIWAELLRHRKFELPGIHGPFPQVLSDGRWSTHPG